MATQPIHPNSIVSPVQRVGHPRSRRMTVIMTAFTASLALIFMWPFLAILGQSFNRLDARMNPLSVLPTAATLERYILIVTRYHLERYILNSITVVLTSTILSTLVSALAGYTLAKLEFRGRRLVFLLILAIMLLPLDTMLVPRFIVLRQLNLVNNYWGLILPSLGGGAFGIFLMRQFMLQIPTEMLEAGRIDGCSELGLFVRLALPNMRAPISVLGILSLSAGWNAVLWPQILINDEAKQLIMPAIIRLNTTASSDPFALPVVISASLACALLPLVLYLYSQKFFTATLTGAIKG